MKKLSKIRFPQQYFYREPCFWKLFPWEPTGTFFIARIPTIEFRSIKSFSKCMVHQGSTGNNC
jgi:hypothetical protein